MSGYDQAGWYEATGSTVLRDRGKLMPVRITTENCGCRWDNRSDRRVMSCARHTLYVIQELP